MEDNTNTNGGGAPDAGGNGGTPERPTWMSSLPDDLKTNEVLAQFPSIGEAAKSLVSFKASEGKALTIPDEKATDEERASFYTKLGRPESPDKYSITKPDTLPEHIPYNVEVEKAYKDFAFKSGLTDAQAKGLYGWYHELVISGAEQQAKIEQEATDKALNALKDEWKGDDFAKNSSLAQRAFKEFLADDKTANDFVKNTKINGVALGNHPVFLKVFANIAKQIMDDSTQGGDNGPRFGEKSEEEKAKELFPSMQKK